MTGHSIAGGIAIGAVLLPEMSRRITANDHDGAMKAARAFDFTLLFSVPFVAAFLTVRDEIMRALFARGAFSKADAVAAGTIVYALAILVLFGRGWLVSLVRG